MIDLNKKIWQWAVLIALAFIWGSSFILMKQGLKVFSSYQVAAMRMFISFVVLLPLIIRNIKKITINNIKSLLIVAFIGNAFPAFLFTIAQKHIDSSLAGILNSLTPLFTLFIGVILYKAKTGFLNIIGILIALIGSVGLFIHDIGNFFEGNNVYALLIVLATLFYGFNINEVKEKLHDLDGIAISAIAFLFAGSLSGIYLLFSGIEENFANPDALESFSYIAILAIFSSAIAVIAINILIKYTSSIFAASVTYIIPVFAIFWGIMDGELLKTTDIISIVVILAGIYLINKPKKISKELSK